jgi:hypothetical protein
VTRLRVVNLWWLKFREGRSSWYGKVTKAKSNQEWTVPMGSISADGGRVNAMALFAAGMEEAQAAAAKRVGDG